MWLLKRLAPDHRTIADLRRDSRGAIRQVCRQLDLFGGELVAIDVGLSPSGGKFKAQNAKGRDFTHNKLNRQLKDLDKKIDDYLEELDRADEEAKNTPGQPKPDQLREKIEEMKRRQPEPRDIPDRLDQSGQSQLSLTDPDSRSMPVGGGEATVVGYSVQLSVDARNKLIVDHVVTKNATDFGLLSQTVCPA